MKKLLISAGTLAMATLPLSVVISCSKEDNAQADKSVPEIWANETPDGQIGGHNIVLDSANSGTLHFDKGTKVTKEEIQNLFIFRDNDQDLIVEYEWKNVSSTPETETIEFDPNTPGTYTLKVKATDHNGNASEFELNIIVDDYTDQFEINPALDTDGPEILLAGITIHGHKILQTTQNHAYVEIFTNDKITQAEIEKLFIARDPSEVKKTYNLWWDGNHEDLTTPDLSKEGKYIFNYKVYDTYDNASNYELVVDVKADEAPVISVDTEKEINGAKMVKTPEGSAHDYVLNLEVNPTATWDDTNNLRNQIESLFTFTDNVALNSYDFAWQKNLNNISFDISKEGNYNLFVSAIDNAGNRTFKNVLVKVVKTEAPVVYLNNKGLIEWTSSLTGESLNVVTEISPTEGKLKQIYLHWDLTQKMIEDVFKTDEDSTLIFEWDKEFSIHSMETKLLTVTPKNYAGHVGESYTLTVEMDYHTPSLIADLETELEGSKLESVDWGHYDIKLKKDTKVTLDQIKALFWGESFGDKKILEVELVQNPSWGSFEDKTQTSGYYVNIINEYGDVFENYDYVTINYV